MGKFTVASGELSGKVIQLKPGRRLVFGREAADVPFPDKRISRRHCIVEMRPEGMYVKDLNSTNGTFVNGEQVLEAVISDGDTLRVGFTDLTYEAGPADEAEGVALPEGAAPAEEAEKRRKFVRSKSRIMAAKYSAMGKDIPSKSRQLISAKGRFCEACGEAVSPEDVKEMEGVWLCPMCALIAEKQKEGGGDFLPSYAKIVGGRLPGEDGEPVEEAKTEEKPQVEQAPVEEPLGPETVGKESRQTQRVEGKEKRAGAEEEEESERSEGVEEEEKQDAGAQGIDQEGKKEEAGAQGAEEE